MLPALKVGGSGCAASCSTPDASCFNGFPRGIADTEARLNNRDLKLKPIVHGEMNAILAAARVGIPLKGCTLYFAAPSRWHEDIAFARDFLAEAGLTYREVAL